MLDRGPVGWLPLEPRKKKVDFIKFLPDEALLSTNFNNISSIYYIELKSTEICEKIVKNCLHIQYMLPNMTCNWYSCNLGIYSSTIITSK